MGLLLARLDMKPFDGTKASGLMLCPGASTATKTPARLCITQQPLHHITAFHRAYVAARNRTKTAVLCEAESTAALTANVFLAVQRDSIQYTHCTAKHYTTTMSLAMQSARLTVCRLQKKRKPDLHCCWTTGFPSSSPGAASHCKPLPGDWLSCSFAISYGSTVSGRIEKECALVDGHSSAGGAREGAQG